MKAWVAGAAALLVGGAQESNEAEKLFRRMEKKLLQAETIALEGQSDYKIERGVSKMEWSVLLAKGHKFNYSIKSVGEIITPDLEGISDGRDVRVTAGGKIEDRKVHGDLSTNVVGTFARAGFVATMPVALEGDRPDRSLDERYKVSEFELGKKEKVGDKDAQVLRYSATFVDRDKATVELWVDVKDELPVKRVLSYKGKDESIVVTETYKKIVVGEKIDAVKFELQKK